MKMQGAVLGAVGAPLDVQELELAQPGPGEILVRLGASGVCHTDHHVYVGGFPHTLPTVLGHEGAGVVEEVGPDVDDIRPGDTVVLVPAPPCGRCWYCVRGETGNCANANARRDITRLALGDGTPVRSFCGLGTFAPYTVVDQNSAVRVRTDLPPEQLALVGCGVLTGTGAVLSSSVRPGSSVLVMGCGGVGLAAVQGAVVAGATEIIAVDPVAMKRDAALALGATVVVDPTSEDVGEVARAHTEGRGVDEAFEAVGSSKLVVQAMRATRPGGITRVIGVADPSDLLEISAVEILSSRKTIAASVLGGGDPRKLVPEIVRLAETGRIDLGALVTRTIGLDNVNDAFRAMEQGTVLRSVIRYS